MTPEELTVYVAKLKEESLNKRRAKDRERHRNWRRKNPSKNKEYRELALSRHSEKIRRREASNSLKRVGVTLEEKEAMMLSQNGCCAICGTTSPNTRGWHVDHCHSTKRVRDVLCRNCNLMLGHARDDVSILLRAIYYLDRHSKPVTFKGNHYAAFFA